MITESGIPTQQATLLLLGQIASGEALLQQELANAEAKGTTTASRQLVAHATRTSRNVTTEVDAVYAAFNQGECGAEQPAQHSTELIAGLHEAVEDGAKVRGNASLQPSLDAATAILRITQLRLADLMVLRALMSTLPDCNESVERISSVIEESYLSVERLRGLTTRVLNNDASGSHGAYEQTCSTCHYWSGDRSGDEPSKAACGHPDLVAIGLKVSRQSGCKRHTPRSMSD